MPLYSVTTGLSKQAANKFDMSDLRTSSRKRTRTSYYQEPMINSYDSDGHSEYQNSGSSDYQDTHQAKRQKHHDMIIDDDLEAEMGRGNTSQPHSRSISAQGRDDQDDQDDQEDDGGWVDDGGWEDQEDGKATDSEGGDGFDGYVGQGAGCDTSRAN